MKLWIVILMLMGTALVFAFSVLAQGSPPVNPFLPYADLLTKDQILTAMERWKFSCIEPLSMIYQECSLELAEGMFSRITVMRVHQLPRSVTFSVCEDALRVGDLAALWGKPDVLFPHSAPRLLWQDQDGTTISAPVPSADRLNHFAPVWVVSFTF